MDQLINNEYNKNLTQNLIKNDKEDIEKAENDKYININNKINDIKEQMIDNIEESISRKQNIDLIIHNAENLEGYSLNFSKEATKLKKKQCWSIWKCKIYIFIILLFTIFIVVLISCKFNLRNCN